MKGKGRSIATQSNWEALSRCVSSLCLDFLLQEMVSAIHLQGEAVGSEHLECASPLWSPSISQPHHPILCSRWSCWKISPLDRFWLALP